MGWWKDTKKALGISGGSSSEEADRHGRADELLADPGAAALCNAALKRLQRDPDAMVAALEHADAPPIPHDETGRRNWVRDRILDALTHPALSATYVTTGVLGREIAARLRDPSAIADIIDAANVHERCEEIAGLSARRLLALSTAGMALVRRIEAEAALLSSKGDREIGLRFSQTPYARIDPVPATGEARIRWLREMLLAEAACVRTGMVPPERAIAISRLIPADVLPGHPTTDGPITIESRAYHPDLAPWGRIAEQASQLCEGDDETLRKRFARLPRIASAAIPVEREERCAWTRRALGADHLRRIAGIAQQAQDEPTGGAVIAIELLGIETGEAADGSITYEGTLFVDGRAVCDIASPGLGEIHIDGWAEGCGPEDLDALSAYVAVTGMPREDGRPDSLADRLLDQVSMKAAVGGYRRAAVSTVLFITDGKAAEPVLLGVPVPEGGSRSGAAAHIRANHPHAVILDELDEEDAALVWLATA